MKRTEALIVTHVLGHREIAERALTRAEFQGEVTSATAFEEGRGLLSRLHHKLQLVVTDVTPQPRRRDADDIDPVVLRKMKRPPPVREDGEPFAKNAVFHRVPHVVLVRPGTGEEDLIGDSLVQTNPEGIVVVTHVDAETTQRLMRLYFRQWFNGEGASA